MFFMSNGDEIMPKYCLEVDLRGFWDVEHCAISPARHQLGFVHLPGLTSKDTTQHNTAQRNTTQRNTTQHNTTHHYATQRNATQHSTT